MTHHRPVVRGDPPDRGGDRCCLGPALVDGQGGVPLERRAERVGPGVLSDVVSSGLDDRHRVGLGLRAGVTPGGDAVSAEDAADRLRVLLLDLRDVQAELEAGASPRDPHDGVAEDGPGQLLTVRSGGDRDPGVGVQVVDVGGVDEAVHGGVDRRRGATTRAVQAVVERRDHLVLALDTRVDVHQRPHPVQAQDSQPAGLQRAEVSTGALDPQQLDVLARDRVGLGALGRGVPPGVVRVPGVGAQAVGPLDELGHDGVLGGGLGHVSSILLARRPRGRTRSVPGTRWRGRHASGRQGGRVPRATRPGHGVRRCRTRP